MPGWYRTYQSAKLLNCAPWELEERDDGDWWIGHSLLAASAEAKAQANWDKTRRKA